MNPTPPETALPIADDAKLVHLSAEPAHQLFPTLNRASMMQALVVLFAFVPGIYALQQYVITESDALWGLKCLDMLSGVDADTVHADTVGGKSSDAVETHWNCEPPLASWLTALTFKLVDPRLPHSFLLTSYFAVAAIIGVSYMLGRTLLDARFGLLIVLLLACHGPVLRLALSPASNALALLCTLLALLGWGRHMMRVTGAISLDLSIAALGLAVCLLAAGPIALAVFAAMLFTLVWRRSESMGFSSRQALKTGKRRAGWSSVIFLFLWGSIAFALVGWWPLMMSFRHGTEFWTGWFSGVYGADTLVSADSGSQSAFEIVGNMLGETILILGFLSGLTILGIWLASREILHEVRRSKLFHRSVPQNTKVPEHTFRTKRYELIRNQRYLALTFLFTWTICGAVAWLISRLSGSVSPDVCELWLLFLMMPLIFLAAFGLDEIINRRAGIFEVVGITLVSMLAVSWNDLLVQSESSETILPLIAGLVVSIAVVAWLFQLYTHHREFVQQKVLKASIVLLVLANGLAGLNSVRIADRPDADFQVLRRRLVRMHDVSACTLMSDTAPPARLVFALRSLWPTARLRIVQRWEDVVGSAVTFPNAVTATNTQNERRATTQTDPNEPQRILVVWGSDWVPLASADGERLPLTPVAPPYYLEQRLLSVHRLLRVDQ